MTAEAKSKTYGEEDPALTYAATGFVAEDGESVMRGELTREAGEAKGAYGILQGALSAGENYEILFTGAILTINPMDDGSVTTETVLEEGAPNVTASNMDEVADAVLDEAERKAVVDGGAAVRVWLEVTALERAGVDAADASALEAHASSLGAVPGQWLDLSVWKSVTGFAATQVHDTVTPVRFTLTIPEDLRRAGRTFWLLSVHDGRVTVVATGTGDALSGESSLFSTYLIAYRDPAPASSAARQGSTISPRAIPQTGDAIPALAGAAVLLGTTGAAFLTAGLGARRSRRPRGRHMAR